uniref:SENP2 n=1 Tax=Piliocolobus tephrosceles TaxID=591936 RepID=A0A8C9H672_9PRIM
MYRWLVRILGTIFRFCDRSVPPARALLKRRRSDSTLFSTVDTDEIPAKRPRLARLCQEKEKVSFLAGRRGSNL